MSVGYKNLMSSRRSSWRVAQQYSAADENDADLRAYRDMIATEIQAIINMVITDVVEKFTSGLAEPDNERAAESLVFFRKMEGDYYRYGAETSDGATREEFKNKAETAYGQAQKAGESGGLKPTNPIWLGLALNQSLFLYEICDKSAEAQNLAKTHFDNALSGLDDIPIDQETDKKDATLIMQLLRDNLTLWNSDSAPVGDDDMEVTEMEWSVSARCETFESLALLPDSSCTRMKANVA